MNLLTRPLPLTSPPYFSPLLLPQATLKEPPRAAVSMQKTIVASYSSTGAFYFSIACLGYAALGATVPGDVLVGFDVSKEVELMANSAVLFHMIAAVQVGWISTPSSLTAVQVGKAAAMRAEA